MAILGELAVNLVARTQQFSQGMDRARKKTEQFTKTANKTEKALRGIRDILIAGGVAGIASGLSARVGRFADEFTRVAQEIDKTAKAAAGLGIASEELDALAHAADLSGASFDSLSTGLARMQRVMSDARQGLSEAEEAFQALNLDVDKMVSLRPEQQLGVIADALGQVSTQAEKMDLVQSIFGRGGKELIPLLDQGRSGLASMRNELASVNALFTDAEKKRVEEFNDELTRLSAIAGGLKNRFVIEVSPAAEKVLESLRGIVTDPAFQEAFKRSLVPSGLGGLVPFARPDRKRPAEPVDIIAQEQAFAAVEERRKGLLGRLEQSGGGLLPPRIGFGRALPAVTGGRGGSAAVPADRPVIEATQRRQDEWDVRDKELTEISRRIGQSLERIEQRATLQLLFRGIENE